MLQIIDLQTWLCFQRQSRLDIHSLSRNENVRLLVSKIRKQLKAVSSFQYVGSSHSKCAYLPKEENSIEPDD